MYFLSLTIPFIDRYPLSFREEGGHFDRKPKCPFGLQGLIFKGLNWRVIARGGSSKADLLRVRFAP